MPRLLFAALFFFLIIALSACQSETSETAPEAVTEYGAPVRAAEAVPAPAVLADLDTYLNRTVTTEGRVTKVCQKKGCWLILDTGAQPIRVHVARTEHGEYAFTVPTDISGAHAIVTGTLKRATLDPDTQKHLAEDATSSETAELPSDTELQITARGVVIEKTEM